MTYSEDIETLDLSSLFAVDDVTIEGHDLINEAHYALLVQLSGAC